MADASQTQGAIAIVNSAFCVPQLVVAPDRQSAGCARHRHLFLEQFGVVFVVLVRAEFLTG
jgi:hypothetical protein